ncbi:Ger(x)C family spore germination protein [Paenibacillus qinlingensis]|uniref:Ger(x)C family spore germination protein n=1 Tax=Paenibacillus qinlingensis TaxID=1837343 RepID=UPI00156682E6|nr:Ger(x)C family spore germination protein [Paenibacillus qinlingensis]NQX63847.1 Ger(x)C family spore germination protein [Paenibacillus qinlingensis]
MKRVIAALLTCLLLTGCWDQSQLKKLLFVDVVGVDYEGDSKQLKVSYVISSLQHANQGGGNPNNLFMESTGDNIYDAVSKTNKQFPGILSVLETRLFLISTKFAKDQPLNHLNITSQFIANPLYGYLAIYDGDLSKLLSTKKIKDQTLSEFLVGLLQEDKKRGKIPSSKLVQFILGGAGFLNDFALNRFEPYENGVHLAGTSLFRDGTYTGINLDDEDTHLATLLDGTSGQNQLITGKLNGKSYSVQVQNAHRDFHINDTDGSLRDIEISLKLDLKLIKAGLDMERHTEASLRELEKQITADITAKATNVIATLQRTNCDYLQLGHEVSAYHPKLFGGIDWWREQYPKISIKPTVNVKILNTGILE